MKAISEIEIHREIVRVCQRLYQRNLLAATDGNVSFRVSDERILITPSGVSKAFIGPEDLCVINLKGDILSGKPSSEMLMHLEVFRKVPQAKAVVHAHPPHAIAWSLAHPELVELPNEYLSEIILATGSIPVVPYARPGTSAMGEVLRPFLPSHRVMILNRHGGLSWGEDLAEAINGMERLEHSAQILSIAWQMGEPIGLPQEEIQALKDIRRQNGDRSL